MCVCVYVYKQDLLLTNFQGFICHKTQPTNFLSLHIEREWGEGEKKMVNWLGFMINQPMEFIYTKSCLYIYIYIRVCVCVRVRVTFSLCPDGCFT